jgi:hypothetical protein
MLTFNKLLYNKKPGLESREYGRRDPSRWSCGTFYPQKLALTSPTSGGRSVSIVRSRIQATEFSFYNKKGNKWAKTTTTKYSKQNQNFKIRQTHVTIIFHEQIFTKLNSPRNVPRKVYSSELNGFSFPKISHTGIAFNQK